jgi:O-antigen/teichoic acid export membrane protein
VLTLSLVGVVAGPLLAEYVFKKPGAADIIRAAVVAGSFYTIFATLIATYQRQSRFVHVSAMRIAFSLLVLLGVGSLVLRNTVPSLADVSALYIYCAVGLAVIGMYFIVRKIVTGGGISICRQSDYFRIAFVLLLAEVVNQTSNRLDVFFLAAYVGFEDIGLYGAAIRVSVVVALMTTTVSTVMLPRAASALHDGRKFRRYLGLALFYASIQTGIAVLVVIYMDQLITLLFGERYLPARDIASILVLQVLVTAYGSPFQSLVQCGSHPSHMFYVSMMRPALNVLLLPSMIGWFGLKGAALSVATTAGMVTLLMVGAALYTAKARSPVENAS